VRLPSRITFRILASAQLGLALLPAASWAIPPGASTAPASPSPGPKKPLPPAPQNTGIPAAKAVPLEVKLSADRQIFDNQLGRVVATGHASAILAGGQIRAERIEYEAGSRTLYAIGAVRFQRGQQYLQASRLRYSLLEGSGEIEDVYGVLDVDTSLQDFDIQQPPSQPLIKQLPLACTPPMADRGTGDPAATGKPAQRSSAMPPPLGCPGSSPSGLDRRTLNEALDAVAIGKAGQGMVPNAEAPPPSAGGSNQPQGAGREPSASINQRVEDVRFQQSLKVEGRAGVPSLVGLPGTAGTPGSPQAQTLATLGNVELVTGAVSRWRFQARRITITPRSLKSDRASFTNDPFTPAQTWLNADDVVATLLPNGDTLIKARRNRLILDQRLRIPVTREYLIRKDEDTIFNRVVPGVDTTDRDGIFIGYRLPPIRFSENIRLDLQPQFMIQRAIQGTTSSYPLPGQPPGSPNSSQPSTVGDLFGLVAKLEAPLLGFNSKTNVSISTFNPANIANGTRSWGEMTRPVKLPLLGDSMLRLFGAYRYRVWNGSLGEQDVYTAYGISLDYGGSLPNWGNLSSSYFWRLGLGNYQGNAFNTGSLLALWRGNLIASLNGSLALWTGKPLPIAPERALIYSPTPILPGLRLNANVTGELAYYGDGTNQNTFTLTGGPALTLGHFTKPFLDYTEFSVTGGITARQGLSQLSFDRAVDLGTVYFGLTQQLYGPLLFSGGVGYNIDPDSGFYGQVTSSYLEVRWQRRSYDIGLYYSPYDGIGGIRVRLNDFNFKGTGTPFVPYRPPNPQRIGMQRNQL
jgi:hypothetical protein